MLEGSSARLRGAWLVQKNAGLVFNMPGTFIRFSQAVSVFNFMPTYPTCSGQRTGVLVTRRNGSKRKTDTREVPERANLSQSE